MVVRFLLAALAAGIFAGLAMTAAQSVKVIPLIIEAERYEDGTAHGHGSAQGIQRHEEADNDDNGKMLFGVSRLGGTVFANIVIGAGYALVMAAVVLITGTALTFTNAVLWGLFGWMAVQLLPSLGTPPELPGMPTADLETRKIWWAATVAMSVAGIWLFVAREQIAAKVAGGVLIGLPHVFGAPKPDELASDVPAHLASEYAVAALATTLFFWVVLAFALKWFSERFGVLE